MRKAEFTVPQEVAVAFCEELINHNLSNEITGVSEDDELVVEVSYERDESDAIDELEQHLDKLIEEEGEEED